METIEITNVILESVILAVIPILIGIIGEWVRKKIEEAKGKLTLQEMKTIEVITRIVVRAAEQSKAAGIIEDKKRYAMKIIEGYLEKKGIKVDVETIAAAIEAAVHEEKRRG